MIVIDASAAVSGLLNDGQARRLLATERLHAPHLIDSEIVSALRRLVRVEQLVATAAHSLIDTWRRLGVTRYPGVGLLPRVWELHDSVSAYDATFVALAEALHCSVVTADGRLAGAPQITCPITVVPS